MQSIDKVKINQ